MKPAAHIYLFLSLMIATALTAGARGVKYDPDKGKYGIENDEGKWAVKPKYDAITEMPGQGYVVMRTEKDGSRKGFYNLDFKEAAGCDYTDLAVTPDNYLLLLKNGKWGEKDFEGKQILKHRFKYLKPGTTGLLCAVTEQDVPMLIATNGIIVKEMPEYTGVEPFSPEFLLVTAPSGGKGLLKFDGSVAVPVGRYDSFADSNTHITVTLDGRKGALDPASAQEIIRPAYTVVTFLPLERYFMVESAGLKALARYPGGEVLFPPRYDDITVDVNDNTLFLTTRNGRKGLCRLSDEVLPCEYDWVRPLTGSPFVKGGKAVLASTVGTAHLYDMEGRAVFDSETPFGDGGRAVSGHGSAALVDKEFRPLHGPVKGTVALEGDFAVFTLADGTKEIIDRSMRPVATGRILKYSLPSATDSVPYAMFFISDGEAGGVLTGHYLVSDLSGKEVAKVNFNKMQDIYRQPSEADSVLLGGEFLKFVTEVQREVLDSHPAMLPETLANPEIDITLNSAWSEIVNVKGVPTLRIHADFSILGAARMDCVMVPRFYFGNGQPMLSPDSEYRGDYGQVCARAEFMPGYADTRFRDLTASIPLTQLHLVPGLPLEIMFDLRFDDESGRPFDIEGVTRLTVTVPAR